MNDITKARAFLSTTGSKLEHLVSFGLMLATAEQNYRDLKLRKQGRKDIEGSLDEQEVQILVEVAVLRYLKRRNRLPSNLTEIFANDVTLDRKKELAASWING